MYYKILVNKKFVPRGFVGITIYPFIIFRFKDSLDNNSLIYHEKIHIRQQLELLVILFYLWYSIEFFVKYLMFRDKHKAYKNISFEREAYENDRNNNYLKQKKLFSFLKYI